MGDTTSVILEPVKLFRRGGVRPRGRCLLLLLLLLSAAALPVAGLQAAGQTVITTRISCGADDAEEIASGVSVFKTG